MDSLHTIDIPHLLALSPVMDEYSLGEDFILGEVGGSRSRLGRAVLDLLRYPVRFDGYTLFFLKKGNGKLEVNLNSYEVGERTLLMNVPGNMMRLDTFSEDTDLLFVLISKDFMHSLRVDFHQLFRESLRLRNTPCVTLGTEDLQLLESYLSLIREMLASRELQNKREVLGSLLASLAYFSMDVWKRSLAASKDLSSPARNHLFERFIALVTEYHLSERGVTFYAEKLNLTPKYLSKIIKHTTGHSAPEWIDAFVILEAKNMLKYSGKCIKEIVYALHFPNQSVFYKYFKAHTGLTPSEYRRG